MLKPITISLSPNTEKDDISLAFKLIFNPFNWKKGIASRALEEEFKGFLGVNHVFAFNSGRTSLMAILGGLEVKGEVLLQAFTCNAAANPVQWSRLKPVFVDCNENDFNMNPEDLERKISSESRIVMVQHTFGLPADIEKIKRIAKEKNLVLIEDCAHSLGAEYKGEKVGTFGKASFFSFSRDKVISSVYGGIVATNDDELAKKIRNFQKETDSPSSWWIFQQLLHPILMNCFILPTYSFCGKYFLVLFQWLKILSKAVHWKEKKGKIPSYFPKRMPNALALLALNQMKKLDRFNCHRKKISSFYYKKIGSFELPVSFPERENIFLRFSVKSQKAHKIIRRAWDKNILIGDWYTSPVAPDDTQLEKVGYKKGSCPEAERLSKITFNLPTHISIREKEAGKIVDFLKKF